MNKENLLGAPTEGLGQTVTFAAGAQGAGSQLQPGGPARSTVGVSGGQQVGVTLATAQPVREDPTMALLFKVSQNLLAPLVKQARQDKFVEGMHMAAAGAAIGDMVDSQPWYVKMAGESDVVAGARAYTQQTRAQQVVLGIQEDMPKMAEMSVSQFGEELKSRVNGAMTGDSETDAVLMQAFTRVLPGISATHARESYKHINIKAAEAAGAMRTTGATSLQNTLSKGLFDGMGQDEVLANQANFAGLFNIPAGADESIHSAQIASDIIAMSENGQFHAVQALRSQGVIDKLPKEKRAIVLDRIDRNEQALAGQAVADPYWERFRKVSQSVHMGEVDPLGAMAEVSAINSDFRLATGSSRDLLAKGSGIALAGRAEDVLRDMQAKAFQGLKAANAKADKEAAERDTAIAAFNSGMAAQANSMEIGVSDAAQEHAVRTIAMPVLVNGGDPQVIANLARWEHGGGKGIGYIKGNMAQTLHSAITRIGTGDTKAFGEFARQYDNYRELKAAGANLTAFYDTDTLWRMERFSIVHPTSVASLPADSWGTAFGSAFGPDAVRDVRKLDKGEIKEVLSTLKGDRTFWTPKFLGGEQSMSDRNLQRLADNGAIRSQVEVLAPAYGVDRATKMALQSARDKGLQFVGDYMWTDPDTAGKSIEQVFKGKRKDLVFPADTAYIGWGIKEFIASKNTGDFYDDSTADLIRIGGGKLMVNRLDRNGAQAAPLTTSYEEIGQFIHNKYAESRKSQAAAADTAPRPANMPRLIQQSNSKAGAWKP